MPLITSKNLAAKSIKSFSKQPVVQPKRVKNHSKTEVFDNQRQQRLESTWELGKHSKQIRRNPVAISHGDFQRSLYGVTINSIVKLQSRGGNA